MNTGEFKLQPYSSSNDDIEGPIYNNKVGKELVNDEAPLGIDKEEEAEHDPSIYLSISSRQDDGMMGGNKNNRVQKRQWRQVTYYTSFILWKDW